ncbi:MAG: ABC transporter substrate-binding protein [Planctomyces sp.]|nr:ABC transporter substrate-binding protein [Planctomyces sp.]
MPHRFVSLTLCVAVASAALSSGCRKSGDASGDIAIGHYASMTGPEATFGQSTDNGVRLALEEYNAAASVGGNRFRLITYDDKGEAAEAGVVVTRLVTRDKVTAVIGEVASGLSLAGADVCQQNGVPMVTPSSTNVDVTKKGDMIFRVCFIDPFQGYVCAKFAREHEPLKAQKAAVLFDQRAPYSVDLAKEFARHFETLGGTVVARQSFTGGDQDFSAQLTSIRSSSPDIVFVPGYYTDVGNIAVQARNLGIKVPLMGGDGWDSEKLTEIGGAALEGCFYSNHYSHQDPSPRVQEFITKYRSKFNKTPDGLAALGYDAARILFEAIDRAQSRDGAAIARELAATQGFDGVTGRISIDADRNPVKQAVILEIKGGVPTFVTTIEPER